MNTNGHASTLPPRQADALAIIRRGPIQMMELARQLGIRSASASRLVDKLAIRGAIRRIEGCVNPVGSPSTYAVALPVTDLLGEVDAFLGSVSHWSAIERATMESLRRRIAEAIGG